MAPSPAHVFLVTVPDGCEAATESLLISGALEQAGLSVSALPAEYCTEEASFVEALHSRPGAAVVLPYRRCVREFLAHTAGVVLKAGLPVLLAGDGLVREGVDRAGLPDGLETSAEAIPDAVSDWVGRVRRDPKHCGLGFAAFGDEYVLGVPQVSLFQERGTLPLLARRGSRDELSPTAQLALLEAPLQEACALDLDVALAPLAEFGGDLRHIEWRDRDVSPALLACVQACRDRVARQSVRVRPEGKDASETLECLVEAGVTRVVFEIDRINGVAPMAGSSAATEDVEDWVVEARRLELDLGYLLVVGLPGETKRRGAQRVETLRRFLPQHLRCVPFEPTGGTPAWHQCAEAGAWPPAGESWIREVIRPLNQASLSAEDFLVNWSSALDLMAEVEFRA
jgi:hypothetical protein